MRITLLILTATILLTACNNNAKTAKTFCDTTCNSDTILFKGNEQYKQSLTIGIKNCKPDTLSWTHGKIMTSRRIQLPDFLNQDVRLNKSAVNVAFQDT